MQDGYLIEMSRLALVKLARIERIASRRFERILTVDGAMGPGAATAGELSWPVSTERGSRRARG